MVVNDAGPWFADTLESLAAQDYPNVGVLVIDNNSRQDPTDIIAAVLPRAFVTRLDRNIGFGPAANHAKSMVEGAAFYLFCHDDVVLAPSATRALVEEAFRENAGVVGAKIVDSDSPSTLLEIGWSVDRFGFRTPVAEPGELDQSQHDATRDTFAVSDAAILVRSDLFDTIGGFADDLPSYDADVDLCWRAHIAGARVIVAPAAVVAHRQAGLERPEFARKRRMEYRARGRMLLSNYTPGRTLAVLPLATLFTFFEALACVLTLQFAKASDIVRSWGWNLAHLPATLKKRALVKRFRVAPDTEVARFQVRGSAAISMFLRGTAASSSDRINTAVGSSRSLIDKLREGPDRVATIMWLFIVAAVGLGSRTLIGGHIPAIREFTQSFESSQQMFGSFWSGWRTTGLGGSYGSPTIIGLMGTISTVLAGSTGLVRWLLIVGLIPVGIAGAWWWMRSSASSQVRGTALLVYVATPVPYNALAEGRWSALAMWAGGPWIVGLIGRAAGIQPFSTPSTRMSPLRAGIGIALVGALVATVFPAVVLALIVIFAAMAIGGVLAPLGSGRERARWDQALIAGGTGLVGTVLLHLPWVLGMSSGLPSWSDLVGTRAVSGGRLSVADLLTLNTGTNSMGWVSGALLLVGVLAIATSKQWRFRLATQGLILVLIGAALAWLGQVHLGPAMPSPEALLVLVCLGLAILAGASMGAFESDVAGGDFGWKQALAAACAGALLIGCLPLLTAAFGGRWGLPEEDHAEVLHTLNKGQVGSNFRTLWLGVDDTMPLGGWRLSNGVTFATTDGLDPHMGDWFPGPESEGTKRLRSALEIAARGETGRLGQLLAPMGIKYVVVIHSFAPTSVTREVLSPDTSFERSLTQQQDLKRIPMSVAFTLLENSRWVPIRAVFPAGALDAAGTSASQLLDTDLSSAKPALAKVAGSRSFEGRLTAGTELYVGSTPDSNWSVTIDGKDVGPKSTFGWASRYPVPATSTAVLEWNTPPVRIALLLLQAALWLGAMNILFGSAFARRIGVRSGTARRGSERGRKNTTPPSTRSKRSSAETGGASEAAGTTSSTADRGVVDAATLTGARSSVAQPLIRRSSRPDAQSTPRSPMQSPNEQPRPARRPPGQTAPADQTQSLASSIPRGVSSTGLPSAARSRQPDPTSSIRPKPDSFGDPVTSGDPVISGDNVGVGPAGSPDAPTTLEDPDLTIRRAPLGAVARPVSIASEVDAAPTIEGMGTHLRPISAETGKNDKRPSGVDSMSGRTDDSAGANPVPGSVDTPRTPVEVSTEAISQVPPKASRVRPPSAKASLRGAKASVTSVGAAKGTKSGGKPRSSRRRSSASDAPKPTAETIKADAISTETHEAETLPTPKRSTRTTSSAEPTQRRRKKSPPPDRELFDGGEAPTLFPQEGD